MPIIIVLAVGLIIIMGVPTLGISIYLRSLFRRAHEYDKLEATYQHLKATNSLPSQQQHGWEFTFGKGKKATTIIIDQPTLGQAVAELTRAGIDYQTVVSTRKV